MAQYVITRSQLTLVSPDNFGVFELYILKAVTEFFWILTPGS
jgi:hypothetical protein